MRAWPKPGTPEYEELKGKVAKLRKKLDEEEAAFEAEKKKRTRAHRGEPASGYGEVSPGAP